MHANVPNNRPMKITTPLGSESLMVRSVSGHEAISEPFEFHLDLAAPQGMPIASHKLLGQPVTVELALPGAPAVRYLHGVVRRFVELGSESDFTRFEALVVPKLWLATQKVRCRVFERMTVPEILAEVLEGMDVRLDLVRGYAARECRVQYRESDFAFASRLMEEEGLFYYFVHSAAGHEMVLSDHVASLAPVAGGPTVGFAQGADVPRHAMQIIGWRKIEDVCPMEDASPAGTTDGLPNLRIEGRGGCHGFAAGAKFTLQEHPTADGDYYLTRIEHTARWNPSRSSAADAPAMEYENRFRCLPAATVYRPARLTPKPTISGLQTATVVALAPGQPPREGSGRVQVRFPWDRRSEDGHRHCCWVRVGQVWTDPRGDAGFRPEVGREVLVAFEEGDPDRPVVTGSVCAQNAQPDKPKAEERVRAECDRVSPILPGLDAAMMPAATSGAGGGMLEWFTGIGGLTGSDAAKTVNEFLPGAQTYTMGTSLSTVMIGDSVSEVLAGAAIQFVVDPESLLDNIPFLGPALGWLVSGCGGVNYATLGPQNTLVYNGPNMNITRGENIDYHTESFWKDWKPVGIAVKVLFLLVTAAAVAGNVLAMLNAETKTSEDGKEETEYPEWAKLISTALASRLLALLNLIERLNAMVCESEEKIKEAMKEIHDAAELAMKFTALKDWATPLIADAAKKGTDAANAAAAAALAATGAQATADEGAKHSRILNDDYSLTGKNISLTSRPPLDSPGATMLSISSVGVAEAYSGNVDISGTGNVEIHCNGDVGMGMTQSTPATGKIALANGLLGSLTLQQGPGLVPGPTTAGIVLSNETGPAINLTAGMTEINSNITLNMTGIKLQFGPATSLAIDATGITATVGANKLVIGLEGITIEATPASTIQLQPTQMSVTTTQMTLSPTAAYSLTTVNITESASGTVARTGSIQQQM